MKKRGLFIAVAVLLTASVWAQENVADQLFEKYAGRDGFTTVHITKGMFNLVSQLDSEDKDAAALMNGLESVNILAMDNDQNGNTGVDFYNEVVRDLPVKGYDELMAVQGKDEKVKIVARTEAGYIRELLLLVGGKDDNAMIDIRGIIDMKQIAELSKAIHVSGMEELQKLDDSKQKEKK